MLWIEVIVLILSHHALTERTFIPWYNVRCVDLERLQGHVVEACCSALVFELALLLLHLLFDLGEAFPHFLLSFLCSSCKSRALGAG